MESTLERLSRIQELLALCRVGEEEEVKARIETDASLAICSNFDGESPLTEACAHGHLGLVKYLLSRGANLDARTHDGGTPLSVACATGHRDIVVHLLNSGAHVNPQCQLSSPLHESAAYGKVSCCRVLLAHGALLEVSDCYYGTPLHGACVRGHLSTAKLLLDAGADVNARKIHSTPLHFALEHHPDKTKLCVLLLEYGADVDATNNAGQTPLDILHQRFALLHPFGLEHERFLAVKTTIEALIYYQWRKRSPMELLYICRSTIREAMAPIISKDTTELDLGKIEMLTILPKVLREYLNFSELISSV